jgi:hypothetical protein
MRNFPLPVSSIENDILRVEYLTTIGPCIIGLYAKGVKGNLFAQSQDIHWPTPHGEYFLYGGHRLWTAPEDPFYTCPEGGVHVMTENGTVILRGEVDASGLEKEISFCLSENRVELSQRVTWHGKEPREFAAWGITQLRLGGLAILPQSNLDGLQPNRKLVFWPYSRIDDERLELHDDMILVYGRASEQAFKIGTNNSHGWIACPFDHALFVKRFAVDDTQIYPDLGCNVEAYVKDSYVELETLGPLRTLNPNESITLQEGWEVSIGEYSPTLKAARTISSLLSRK